MRRISLAIIAFASSAGASAAGPLAESQWIAPGADVVAALTVTPGECYRKPEAPEAARLAEIGRIAFRSPLTLGGQAARAGLSCASCHVDGRSNPDFFLDGLSGAPGTADVTTSLFSAVREDGDFNPVPIPSLVDVKKRTAFGTTRPASSLHAFIAGALVEEFQAAPPTQTVLDGLVAYVGALDTDACPNNAVALSARRAMEDVSRALAAAKATAYQGDASTADFLLASAQVFLGRINERFQSAELAPARADLAALSKAVGAARSLSAGAGAMEAAIDDASTNARELARRLHKMRRHSLYDPANLAQHLQLEAED